MVKHRTHSIAFKRQVVQEYLAGETLHGLARRHDLSRSLIRIWVDKYEAGADIAALAGGGRLRSRNTRRGSRSSSAWPASRRFSSSFVKGALRQGRRPSNALHVRHRRPHGLSVAEGCRLMGIACAPPATIQPKGAADDTALVESMRAIKDEIEAYGWRRLQAALKHRGLQS